MPLPGMARPSRNRRAPIPSVSATSLNRETSTTGARSWQKRSAMRAEALRKMLAQASDNGKNNLLIRLKLIDLPGKNWFDTKEDEASIIKPEGGKYRFLARVQMGDRAKLAAGAKKPSNGSLVSLKASRPDFNADVENADVEASRLGLPPLRC
jgi:hypothetical protein